MSRVLRPKQQCILIAVSRATLHRLEKSDPTFPAKIQLGTNSVGRLESDLMTWLESKKGASHE